MILFLFLFFLFLFPSVHLSIYSYSDLEVAYVNLFPSIFIRGKLNPRLGTMICG